ncbi:uncharacterized protein LOC117571537 [Drosophila albomicans]|uniref:Uncharacterized protein LOC117571537 n=1 Tax=Drosophila albomicans TaxID=7291 RepID=A0A9C6SY98_DROAB|nr:uncharacterized protein LOC117571537 [Drosophila albomicans]
MVVSKTIIIFCFLSMWCINAEAEGLEIWEDTAENLLRSLKNKLEELKDYAYTEDSQLSKTSIFAFIY